MRHYCKILVDPVTGKPQHMTVSTEPLNDDVGVSATGTETHTVVIGTPVDGLPKQRAHDLFRKLQGNPAKQFTFRPEVPQNERPSVTIGQEALDMITARKTATGRV